MRDEENALGQSLPIGRHWLTTLLVAGSRLRSSGPALMLSSSHGAQLGWSEMAANVCGETATSGVARLQPYA